MAAGGKPWWIIVESAPSEQATNQLFGPYPPGTPIYFQGTKAQATAEANLTVKSGSTSNGPFGPFPSKAAAEASWKANAGNVQHAGTGGPVSVPTDPLGWLQGIAHWIGEAVVHILDIHMWRSIGWITMGLVLLVLGIFLWLRKADLIEPPGVSSATLRAARAA